MANKTRNEACSADIPLKPEPDQGIPVADAIQAGVELINKKKKKCDKKKKIVKPLYKDNPPQCPRCYVKKILWPEPDVFPGCNHGKSNNFQLRLGINREHHLKVLAEPHPSRLVKPKYPVTTYRPIQCATFRLAQLARPKKLYVRNTWSRYAEVLDPYHIENCRKQLQDLRFTATPNAIEYFTQKKRIAQNKREQRRREIRKLRRRIREMKHNEMTADVKHILYALFKVNRSFLLSNNVNLLTKERLDMSDYLLRNVCAHLRYSMPRRGSRAFFDTFIVNVCDNLAIWLTSLRTNCNYNVLEEMGVQGRKAEGVGNAKQAANLEDESQEAYTVPIDGYIDYSTDDISSTDCDEDQFDMDEEGNEEEEMEDEGEDGGVNNG